jgi:hypothetical protein
MQSGLTAEQATETIMTQICTIENARTLINNWYDSVNANEQLVTP